MRKTCHSCEIVVKPQNFFGITAEECFRVMYLRPHTIENELSATRGTTRQKPFGLEDLDHRVTPMQAHDGDSTIGACGESWRR
jgi:hypothetical protein